MVTAASNPEDLAELHELLRTAGVATVGEGGHAWIIYDLAPRVTFAMRRVFQESAPFLVFAAECRPVENRYKSYRQAKRFYVRSDIFGW